MPLRPYQLEGLASVTQASGAERQWWIYILRDPRDNAIRYVGKTHRIKTRLNTHMSMAGKETNYKSKWLLHLKRLGLVPTFEIIETGTGNGWYESEQRWIRHFRAMGCALTNLTDGGPGLLGVALSDETKAKIRAKHLGKTLTAEHRLKLSIAHKGQRPVNIEQLRVGNIGRKHSPEHLAKLALARVGFKMPPEAVKRHADAIRGRKRSPEVVKAHAERMKGHPVSPETRARIGAAHKGLKPSEETIAKMRIAAKERWVVRRQRIKGANNAA